MARKQIVITIQQLIGEISISGCTKLTEQQTLEIQNQVTEAILKVAKSANRIIAEDIKSQLLTNLDKCDKQ